MSRPVKRDVETIKKAKFWTTIEPIFPILLSFTINIGLVSIAADKIYPLTLSGSQAQMDKASNVGNTNFAEYLDFKGASVLWGLALLAAAQSSSITTTYSGQYIMDGFLRLRIPVWLRAVLTRLVAILPCVVVAATMDAEALNITINIVNATLGIMLPFALTPLAKFSTSKDFLGEHCPGMVEKVIIWLGAFLVYVTNAYGMSAAGGGLFGGYIDPEDGKQTVLSVQMAILNDALQVLFLAWQIYVIWMPIKKPMRKITCTRFVEDEHCFGIVKNHNKIQHSTSISWDENEEEPCCETA